MPFDRSIYNKAYREANRERIDAQIRAWRLTHKEETRVARLKWRATNRNKELIQQKKYNKDRYKNDPEFRLTVLLRKRLNKALKGGYKKGSAVEMLGCSAAEARAHLEALFRPGMTWENHGEWHIDHVQPLSRFNLQDENQLAEACHYTNLQPLWAHENLSKGDRV